RPAAPQAARQAPQQAPQPTADQAPFFRAFDWVVGKKNEAITGIQGVNNWTREKLRYEIEGVSPADPTVKALPYAAGHSLDGFPGSLARIGYNAVESISQSTRAAVGTAWDSTAGLLYLQPLRHPIQYAKQAARVVTSLAKGFKDAVKGVFIDAPHEVIDRTMNNTLKQLRDIPVVNQILAIPQWITDKAAWISGGIKKAIDWTLSPFDKANNAMAPATATA
ncbi:MAG: hypothetical protein O3B47_05160, partial [bacterium]|nr:hypothetical protein [bacterium]